MAFSDDAWAMERLRTLKDVDECSSFRVALNGAVHRFATFRPNLLRAGSRWSALCGLHPEECPPALNDGSLVTCLGCIAEGG